MMSIPGGLVRREGMTPNSSDPIARVLAAYQAAVYAKDLDAFTSLYDEDVHLFDMWGAWSCQGLPAWRALAADWFASLGSERVKVGVAELQVCGDGDFAAAHAFLRFTAESAEGQLLRSLDNRISLVLQRKAGAWKIVHEHTSAPVDFATGKVVLRRQAVQP
jgi:uncharacterized protein (TIGR02246 family)